MNAPEGLSDSERLAAEEQMRTLARRVLQHTAAPNARGLADAARQLAECVLACLPKGQSPAPAPTAPPSLREIERYGLELRARAHRRYPYPTPKLREKFDAKIAALVKAFAERDDKAANPQAGESSPPAESPPEANADCPGRALPSDRPTLGPNVGGPRVVPCFRSAVEADPQSAIPTVLFERRCGSRLRSTQVAVFC